MSRPDEGIPDSVWGAARGCIEAREFNASHPKNTIARIARAIMSERERCAKEADEWAKFVRSNPDAQVASVGVVAEMIAAAIRAAPEGNRHQSPAGRAFQSSQAPEGNQP